MLSPIQNTRLLPNFTTDTSLAENHVQDLNEVRLIADLRKDMTILYSSGVVLCALPDLSEVSVMGNP